MIYFTTIYKIRIIYNIIQYTPPPGSPGLDEDAQCVRFSPLSGRVGRGLSFDVRRVQVGSSLAKKKPLKGVQCSIIVYCIL